jgi:hypothetical protein
MTGRATVRRMTFIDHSGELRVRRRTVVTKCSTGKDWPLSTDSIQFACKCTASPVFCYYYISFRDATHGENRDIYCLGSSEIQSHDGAT